MRKKILLTVSLLFVLLSAVQLFIHIQALRNQYQTNKERISNYLMDAHIRNLKTVLEGIYSQAQEIYGLEKMGKISQQSAQAQVKSIVQSFRYGNQDYVWINDLEHTILVFPYPQWIGTNRAEYQSPDGKFPFKRIVELAKTKGEGFVEYQAYRVTQNSDQTAGEKGEQAESKPQPQPKLSYVKLFEPWGWVLGTGVYIDDIQKEEIKLEAELTDKIQKMILESVLIIAAVLLISALILFTLMKKQLNPLKKLMGVIHEINQGNLSARATINSRDEIGKLSTTFNHMADSIKDHTENLEEKVQVRTQELHEAFEEVNKLKTQQDGDYFLTSLLIKPLMVNRVKSPEAKIDFFLKQKKDFLFRKRDGEIGGDVCISHQIILRGKSYLAFVNGDAMGKSLQGAGGALVMGAVFNSIISRNSLLAQSQDMAPEIWLSECYQELQQIFESFDGSMMISAVIGLLDLQTGVLYFFNAEHPWPVLYRNGKADFMEKETSLRKLGTVGLEEPLIIRVIRLQKGDQVIMGSDGKDDLLLGVDSETGMKMVNEDERLFLEQVEKSEGDLNQIVKGLESAGELTDDLSLLKISFQSSSVAEESLVFQDLKRQAQQKVMEKNYREGLDMYQRALKIQKDLECYKEAALCLKQLNLVEDLALFQEEMTGYFPEDHQLLYQTSLAFKRLKNYSKALEYGERVRLLDPFQVNNLINLADIYRLWGNIPLAQELMGKVEVQDPENKHLLKLKQLLE